MVQLRRAVPLLLALSLGACADGPGTVRAARQHAVTITTVTAAPPTTTAAPHPPPTQPPRASRSQAHRSPPTVPPELPVASQPAAAANPEVQPECHVRGPKSRAFSDACWRPFVARYSWPVDRMLGILHCESKGDEWAVNGKHRGLLQIAGSNTLGDGPANIAHGHGVFESAGKRGRPTQPWEQCGG